MLTTNYSGQFRTILASGLTLLAAAGVGRAQSQVRQETNAPTIRDTLPDTWTATDALGRRVDPRQYPAVRPNKAVGIFYFIWMQGGAKDKVYDITKILAAKAPTPPWGPKHAFHWWAEPYLGYYRSDDQYVIARHAQMLGDAGVDVIVFDVTNARTYDETVAQICETFAALRKAGRRTPQIAFLAHARHVPTVQQVYDTLYGKGLYRDLWFMWKGKPLLMSSPDGLSPEVADFFTIRHSWAWSAGPWFKDGRGKWPWLDHSPQKPGWVDSPNKPEQISVSSAQHSTTCIGRSYKAGKQPPPGQAQPEQGIYFNEQWKRALQVDPEFVFITGWNEWIAQRFLVEDKNSKQKVNGYENLKAGDTFFVDQYTQEFSRDVEPMRGGHGDAYYYQMVDGIRRYKGVRKLPAFSGPVSIDLAKGFGPWQAVKPEYLDDLGDTASRDSVGYGDAGRLVNDTGRNDLDTFRVTYDAQNVYFYARTKDELRPPSATNWMTLLLDTGGPAAAGWAGYDLAINRTKPAAGETKVERWTQGKGWTGVGAARIVFKDNELHLAVPRELVMRSATAAVTFDFKWTDNATVGEDAIGFIDQGDVAPNGRFNYPFRPTK